MRRKLLLLFNKKFSSIQSLLLHFFYDCCTIKLVLCCFFWLLLSYSNFGIINNFPEYCLDRKSSIIVRIFVKIILAAVNAVCLAITLFYPNSATPFSLLPVIVTLASWVFVSNQNKPHSVIYLEKDFRKEYLICAVVIASMCIILGSTGIISGENGKYIFTFRSEVAFLADLEFDYLLFAATAFISIMILIISEVISTSSLDNAASREAADLPMDYIVRAAIHSNYNH